MHIMEQGTLSFHVHNNSREFLVERSFGMDQLTGLSFSIVKKKW